MLVQRLLTILVLLPVTVAMVAVGGWPFALLITAALGIAGWEYWRIFRKGGYCPSAVVIIGGVVLLGLSRMLPDPQISSAVLVLAVLVSMGIHVFGYERGQERAGSDFAIDLGGVLYLGWLGSYMILLRNLPEGKWLLLLAIPAVWIADSGAFMVGRRIGRHKMAPRVSPGKSWEGYLAGVLFAIPGAGLLALLWGLASPGLTFARGMLLGAVLAILTPLGDLGESVIKRQFGVKDSSHLMPGHGGMLDRIDSLLWAGAISYYMILWFW